MKQLATRKTIQHGYRRETTAYSKILWRLPRACHRALLMLFLLLLLYVLNLFYHFHFHFHFEDDIDFIDAISSIPDVAASIPLPPLSQSIKNAPWAVLECSTPTISAQTQASALFFATTSTDASFQMATQPRA